MFCNNFGILGGDHRQVAMIKSLAADGINVFAAGFEHVTFHKSINKTDLKEAVNNSEYIVLPLPVTKDGLTLNAPFSEKNINLDDCFAKMLSNKKVFCGMLQKLAATSALWKDVTLYDYSEMEEFAVRNAVPTAEGAIEIAMHEYPGTINGSKCLVAGFGRIGKVLSFMLKGIGADVTVSARKLQDIAWIDVKNYHSILTSKICNTHGYDIIFNTIPVKIFNSHILAKTAENALVIDLASSPGGVDFEAAARLGIKAIRALSIPGKVAPKTSGEIIKTTIYNMIARSEISNIQYAD